MAAMLLVQPLTDQSHPGHLTPQAVRVQPLLAHNPAPVLVLTINNHLVQLAEEAFPTTPWLLTPPQCLAGANHLV